MTWYARTVIALSCLPLPFSRGSQNRAGPPASNGRHRGHADVQFAHIHFAGHQLGQQQVAGAAKVRVLLMQVFPQYEEWFHNLMEPIQKDPSRANYAGVVKV